MGKHPKFDGLEYLLDSGETFQLTGKSTKRQQGVHCLKARIICARNLHLLNGQRREAIISQRFRKASHPRELSFLRSQ